MNGKELTNHKTMETIDLIAVSVFTLAKDSLFSMFRFLDIAINQLILLKSPVKNMATDGRYLYYNPLYIVSSFRDDKERITREYLHVILHCVFHHTFVGSYVERRLWDIACDITVENAINDFQLADLSSHRQGEQQIYINKIKENVDILTAEKTYRYLYSEYDKNNHEYIEMLRCLFYVDEHFSWYNLLDRGEDTEFEGSKSKNQEENREDESESKKSGEEDPERDGEPQSEKDSEDPSIESKESRLMGEFDVKEMGAKSAEIDLKDSLPGENNESKENEENPEESGRREGEKDSDNLSTSEDGNESNENKDRSSEGLEEEFDSYERREGEKVKKVWKKISERAEVCLETLGDEWGDKAGSVIQNLNSVCYEKYDYRAFLERFSVLGENIHINDDEFDYIFYTYGLSLYENMPLIEPLEYKEVKRIKEFVIAIDTSGSCSGEVVQSFVQKTYNIIMQEENFFTKINIHIIQCDYKIQEDYKITSKEDFEYYIKNMSLKGFGGTDFRPVFLKVDEMINNKEFTNLKGLIYFTDGYGEFPTKKPDYDVAFVFLDDKSINPEVPVWAIKLVLSKDCL